MRLIFKLMESPMGLVLLKFWQLPQSVIGTIVQYVYMHMKGDKVQVGMPLMNSHPQYLIAAVFSSRMQGGLSLGDTITLPYSSTLTTPRSVMRHEKGHCIQSMLLGWFYLPIIGLSSILWASWHTLTNSKRDYNSFWTERWAEKLAKKYIGDMD